MSADTFARAICAICAVLAAIAWWCAVAARDGRINEIARCADAAVAGQDWTQEDWRGAWDSCWEMR